MGHRAILKYFVDINVYNFPLSLIVGVVLGPLYGMGVFCSFGILVGFLGYQYFNENQYYIYYNLGWTKTKLLRHVWLANLFVSALLILLLLLIW